jgi:UDP-glucose 4-epimerase
MGRVYVTGASGMLGGALVAHLAASGRPGVVAVARQSPPAVPGVAVRAWSGLPDAGWFDPADAKAAVLHFAGAADARADADGLPALLAGEVAPHAALVEALVERGWRGRLILASSAAVYGDAADLPIPETRAPRPRSPYGLAKLLTEQALAFLARRHGFELVILRIANPYGAAARPGKGVMRRILEALAEGRTFRVIGDGSALRDYLHLSDFCRAVAAAIDAPLPEDPLVLNIASGRGLSLVELIARLEALTGRRLERVRVPARPEAGSNVLDIGRARAVLGWEPRIGLDAGLAALVEGRDP